MQFEIPRHVELIAERVRQFVDEKVIPVEGDLLRSGAELTMDRLQSLRAKAKSRQAVGADHAQSVGRHGAQHSGDRASF